MFAPMRRGVFILAGIQVALLIFYAIGSGMSDAAGNAMSQAFITLAGILMAILMVPALILASNNKALNVAMTLSVISLLIVTIGLASV